MNRDFCMGITYNMQKPHTPEPDAVSQSNACYVQLYLTSHVATAMISIGLLFITQFLFITQL